MNFEYSPTGTQNNILTQYEVFHYFLVQIRKNNHTLSVMA